MTAHASAQRATRARRNHGATVALLAGLVIAAGPGGQALAHHSQAPFFDQSRDIEISGVVQRFDFRNPHAILYVEVTGADGASAVWELQFASATILVRAGVSATSFVAGERITAIGHPSRNPEAYGMSSVAVTKTDGSEIVDPLRSGSFAGTDR